MRPTDDVVEIVCKPLKSSSFGVNCKGAGRKGALLRDVYGDLTRSAPTVAGGGTLLVPMWLRGLVPLLMATIVCIISNRGSMAMMAKILSLMMTTILKYHPPTNTILQFILFGNKTCFCFCNDILIQLLRNIKTVTVTAT